MGQVVSLDDIVLLFIQAVGHDDLVGVFLGVDGALLESDVDLGEGHGRRVGPQGLPEAQVVGIFHGPDLLTLEILDRIHVLVGRHDTEALVRVAEQLIAALFVDLLDLIHKFLIVNVGTDILDAVKEAGHVEYRDVRQEGDLRGRVLHDEGDVPVLAGFQKLPVSAQYTVGIDLDPHPAAGEPGDLLRKALRVDLGNCVLRARGPERPGIGHGLP